MPAFREPALRARPRVPPHRRREPKTAADFIGAGAFALGVGVDLAALRRGEAATITEKARQYVAAVAAARG
jgi:2-keto-3-deoxy-6-phosphogluconate aldolase